MDHTGEDGKEPVQTDQGELCKDMQHHPVSVSGHARNHTGRAQISVFYMEYFIGMTLDSYMLFTLESGIQF